MELKNRKGLPRLKIGWRKMDKFFLQQKFFYLWVWFHFTNFMHEKWRMLTAVVKYKLWCDSLLKLRNSKLKFSQTSTKTKQMFSVCFQLVCLQCMRVCCVQSAPYTHTSVVKTSTKNSCLHSNSVRALCTVSLYIFDCLILKCQTTSNCILVINTSQCQCIHTVFAAALLFLLMVVPFLRNKEKLEIENRFCRICAKSSSFYCSVCVNTKFSAIVCLVCMWRKRGGQINHNGFCYKFEFVPFQPMSHFNQDTSCSNRISSQIHTDNRHPFNLPFFLSFVWHWSNVA